MKKLFVIVAVAMALAMSGCSANPFSSSAPGVNRTCVDKFISSLETLKSNGVYACASKTLQAYWFDRNTTAPGRSWKDDSDLTTWLQGINTGTNTVAEKVEEFPGDPIYVYDNNGNLTGYEYHIKLWFVQKDGTISDLPVSFIVILDTSGRIQDIG